jgi:hypothetical protein
MDDIQKAADRFGWLGAVEGQSVVSDKLDGEPREHGWGRESRGHGRKLFMVPTAGILLALVQGTQEPVGDNETAQDAVKPQYATPLPPQNAALTNRVPQNATPAQDPPLAPNVKPASRATQPRPKQQRLAKAPQTELAQPTSASLGDLDPELVRLYVRRNLAQVRYCYEKQRLVEPLLAGTVEARFLITPEGTVASSTATGLDDEVASCVAGVLKNIEFPRSGGNVQVKYPFRFVLGDP